MPKALKITYCAFALTLLAVNGVHAETQWEKEHPRRDQVNDRLANQNRRINNDVKAGTMTPAQAAAAHKADHQVRQEEKLMAGQNGGRITRQQQQTLNQQENAISTTIPPK